MIKLTLYHTPSYFQFYICNEGADTEFLLDKKSQEKIEKSKYVSSKDLISVAVVSEYSEIPISVEYSDDGFDDSITEKWDYMISTHLLTDSGKILFLGCCDDREFGVLQVKPGLFNINVFFGGQNSTHDDGTSSDFYKVRIWPSN